MGIPVLERPKSSRKKGKKNRKHGRQARRPGKARYNAEKRWEKNKARRIAKQRRIEAKNKTKQG
jgi:hypothetical protein